MMWRVGLAAATAVFLAFAPAAFGDGKVFPFALQRVAHPVIPDQQALIHFKDGRETLAIETRFSGEGTDFAWVVPLPSVPQVSAGTRGLFPSLQFLFRQRVSRGVQHWYVLALIVTLALVLLVKRRFELAFAIILTVLICWGMVLPSLGNSRGSAEAVRVHSRETVGAFDVATVSSNEPDALIAWLTRHGYAVDSASQPIIRDYATRGWCFVASRLRRPTSSGEPVTPHPLVFRFATERCVYPLRLTGQGIGERCRIDLYVFGDQRAEVPGFTVRHCQRPLYPDLAHRGEHSVVPRLTGSLPIVQPLLREIVNDAPVATYLSGDLNSDQMREDAWLSWVPCAETQTVVYRPEDALRTAVNMTVPVLCVLGFVVWRLAERKILRRRPVLLLTVLIAVGGAGATYGIRSSLPTPELEELVPPRNRPEFRFMSVLDEFKHPAFQEGDEERARERIKKVAEAGGVSVSLEHDVPETGGIRETSEGIDFVWYDVFGGAHVHRIRTADRSRKPPTTTRGE